MKFNNETKVMRCYNAPSCDIEELKAKKCLLSESDPYSEEGEPGEDGELNDLGPLNK